MRIDVYRPSRSTKDARNKLGPGIIPFETEIIPLRPDPPLDATAAAIHQLPGNQADYFTTPNMDKLLLIASRHAQAYLSSLRDSGAKLRLEENIMKHIFAGLAMEYTEASPALQQGEQILTPAETAIMYDDGLASPHALNPDLSHMGFRIVEIDPHGSRRRFTPSDSLIVKKADHTTEITGVCEFTRSVKPVEEKLFERLDHLDPVAIEREIIPHEEPLMRTRGILRKRGLPDFLEVNDEAFRVVYVRPGLEPGEVKQEGQGKVQVLYHPITRAAFNTVTAAFFNDVNRAIDRWMPKPR